MRRRRAGSPVRIDTTPSSRTSPSATVNKNNFNDNGDFNTSLPMRWFAHLTRESLQLIQHSRALFRHVERSLAEPLSFWQTTPKNLQRLLRRLDPLMDAQKQLVALYRWESMPISPVKPISWQGETESEMEMEEAIAKAMAEIAEKEQNQLVYLVWKWLPGPVWLMFALWLLCWFPSLILLVPHALLGWYSLTQYRAQRWRLKRAQKRAEWSQQHESLPVSPVRRLVDRNNSVSGSVPLPFSDLPSAEPASETNLAPVWEPSDLGPISTEADVTNALGQLPASHSVSTAAILASPTTLLPESPGFSPLPSDKNDDATRRSTRASLLQIMQLGQNMSGLMADALEYLYDICDALDWTQPDVTKRALLLWFFTALPLLYAVIFLQLKLVACALVTVLMMRHWPGWRHIQGPWLRIRARYVLWMAQSVYRLHERLPPSLPLTDEDDDLVFEPLPNDLGSNPADDAYLLQRLDALLDAVRSKERFQSTNITNATTQRHLAVRVIEAMDSNDVVAKATRLACCRQVQSLAWLSHPESEGEPVASYHDPQLLQVPLLVRRCSVYENERWWLGLDWVPHLFSGERTHWSDAQGHLQLPAPDQWSLSKPWNWMGPWRVDENNTEGGWQYGDNNWSHFQSQPSLTRLVRRRRWIREAVLLWGTAGAEDALLHLDSHLAVSEQVRHMARVRRRLSKLDDTEEQLE